MLKTGDVAKRLRVSENTVRDYVNRGWLLMYMFMPSRCIAVYAYTLI